jgi:hypothetical protein
VALFSKKKKEAPHKKTEKDLEGIDPKTYARRWWILGTLCVTLLGVMLANSSLNMALPMMATDLGLTQLELTWVVKDRSMPASWHTRVPSLLSLVS